MHHIKDTARHIMIAHKASNVAVKKYMDTAPTTQMYVTTLQAVTTTSPHKQHQQLSLPCILWAAFAFYVAYAYLAVFADEEELLYTILNPLFFM